MKCMSGNPAGSQYNSLVKSLFICLLLKKQGHTKAKDRSMKQKFTESRDAKVRPLIHFTAAIKVHFLGNSSYVQMCTKHLEISSEIYSCKLLANQISLEYQADLPLYFNSSKKCPSPHKVNTNIFDICIYRYA